ncbi:RNA polymerase sigma factor [Paenibacillus apis]|uniref:DNA-directed RNA polymerase sigma-70 factor n=1 Tax=Paenibacillus apis TaxID=1792174 RepID=A0A919Y8B1_9BACL|nr:sigma-70 family RNA polymerase sigma factor [Paenibacillus apis]GIO44210.1 DNA-directed RNA polymerase sigma-70 factor [Paenibacillus apis]
MDDAELFERIARGDAEALNRLIERHYDFIKRYCYWKTGQAELAEDLTQDTFYRFCRSLSSYKDKGKCRAYLYTIARRLCADAFRERPPEPIEQVPEAKLGSALSAEDEAGAHLQSKELLEVLQELPSELQEAIILRYSYGFRYREIAAITSVPLYKARIRVERGLAAMKKRMREEDLNEKETGRAHNHAGASPCSDV